MKAIASKIVLIGVLLFAFAFTGFSQAAHKKKKSHDHKPVKIEKVKVPLVVTEGFFREYPVTANEFWYGHPGYTADEWYDFYPYYYDNEYPPYYIVEFNKDSTPHRVAYTKEGIKIATHIGLHVPLPAAVAAAISKGPYKSWKIDNHQEEIFKGTENDVLKVYRIVIGKGKGIRTLYYRGDGTLLKDVKHKP